MQKKLIVTTMAIRQYDHNTTDEKHQHNPSDQFELETYCACHGHNALDLVNLVLGHIRPVLHPGEIKCTPRTVKSLLRILFTFGHAGDIFREKALMFRCVSLNSNCIQ